MSCIFLSKIIYGSILLIIGVSSTLVIITEYNLRYIYIKSKFGITHFAHNYMETSHVASKARLSLSQMRYPGMLIS